MRYVVTFFDRTTKRLPLEAAKVFMQAMKTGEPVFFRGNMFSGKSIASVRTILGFYQDKLQEAKEHGEYFCKRGVMHPSRLDCGCRDANMERLLTPDEQLLLPQWNETLESQFALQLLPPKT